MNPVAAGGVVAWLYDSGEPPYSYVFRTRRPPFDGYTEIPLVPLAELTAAQAEADRLRNQYRWLCDNLATVAALMDRDQYATPQRCVEALMPLDDTAINAAKTEQERGE